MESPSGTAVGHNNLSTEPSRDVVMESPSVTAEETSNSNVGIYNLSCTEPSSTRDAVMESQSDVIEAGVKSGALVGTF